MNSLINFSFAKDTKTGNEVTIKKMARLSDDSRLAKLAHRELCLLKFISHENLTKLIDVFTTAQCYEEMEDLLVLNWKIGSLKIYYFFFF